MSATPGTATDCIDLLLLPRFTMAALAGLVEPLRVANRLSDAELYAWRLIAPVAGRVPASNGIDVGCAHVVGDRLVPLPRTLLVCAGFDHERWCERSMLDWLRRLARAGCRLGAVLPRSGRGFLAWGRHPPGGLTHVLCHIAQCVCVPAQQGSATWIHREDAAVRAAERSRGVRAG